MRATLTDLARRLRALVGRVLDWHICDCGTSHRLPACPSCGRSRLVVADEMPPLHGRCPSCGARAWPDSSHPYDTRRWCERAECAWTGTICDLTR